MQPDMIRGRGDKNLPPNLGQKSKDSPSNRKDPLPSRKEPPKNGKRPINELKKGSKDPPPQLGQAEPCLDTVRNNEIIVFHTKNYVLVFFFFIVE